MRRLSRIAAILSAIMLSGCGGSGETSSSTNVPKVTTGVIGETINNGYWELTVNSAGYHDSIISMYGNTMTPYTEGNVFLVVNIKASNLSYPNEQAQDPWNLSGFIDPNGKKGSVSFRSLTIADGISLDPLLIGAETIGNYANEVPVGSSGWKFQFGPGCAYGCSKGYIEVDLGL
ncbi:MAG: DUF4352 domain-containing protein [Nitrospinota bacterium]|nr:DUF4352 domain-containing protein [Nitrospinota bacterium]